MSITLEQRQRMDAGLCIDCGVKLNPGEASVFTCCEACWNKHYGRESQPATPPEKAAVSATEEKPNG